MYNFCRLFKKLYQEPTLSAERINDLRIDRNFIGVNELHELLDEEISHEELEAAIYQLKDGETVAEDVIANEFLKFPRPITHSTIRHLFNEYIRVRVYPWNTSL